MRATPTILLLVLSLCASGALIGQTRYELSRLSFCEPYHDEFAPALLDSTLVFCSNRSNDLLISFRDREGKSLNGLWSVVPDSARTTRIKPFSAALSGPFNEGPLAIHPDGQELVYVRNIQSKAGMRGVNDPENSLGLFFAVRDSTGNWVERSAFKYNDPGYSLHSAAYYEGGQSLVFASDMPGGQGGFDLWTSTREGGGWTLPENLGSGVNSPGNEAFPFFLSDSLMLFSSNGWPGMGGADLFRTQHDAGGWSGTVSLGPPLNSPEDDFGIWTLPDLSAGYFSSNREGSDDIFAFETGVPHLFDCLPQQENNYCFVFWDEEAASADSAGMSYSWEFSDGTRVPGSRVTHCFPGPGSYTARLLVTDARTDHVFKTAADLSFNLEAIEQAFITGPDTVVAGEPFNLSAVDTHLPGFETSRYIWEFGDGTFSTGPETTHVCFEGGEYQIKLGVEGAYMEDVSGQIHCVHKRIFVKLQEDEDE